ncbi:hypothetical protein B0H65DRAFT_438209 [Neurospora tetraspora]|uniref:Uncharacterized protein n=1 Tax=Neurospora tetraspora TaxID=94610 RepID=A0AAE0JNL4_9PEZI|nr:hypothetical protein B0H65DRAFT_438209 [Neurospora tetraspora]
MEPSLSISSAALLLLSAFRLDGGWSTRLRRSSGSAPRTEWEVNLPGSHRSLELASGREGGMCWAAMMAQWLDNLHGSDRSCGVLGSFRPSSDVQPHFSRDELLELLRNDWRRLCIGYLVKHTQGSFWFYLVEPGQMEYCHGNLFLKLEYDSQPQKARLDEPHSYLPVTGAACF